MIALTDRQLEIFRLMPTHSYKEIAKELGIKPVSVRHTQRRIYRNLGIVSKARACKRLKAVLKGIRLGLIDLESVEFQRIRRRR